MGTQIKPWECERHYPRFPRISLLCSPLIQQTFFCFSKNSQSCLLKLTCTTSLSIAWKLIFSRGVVLQPHPRDHSFNELSQFFTFHLILPKPFRLRTVRRFSMRTHLSHAFHISTNTCLPHGKSYAIKPNLILDSSFPCCIWLCCHTHVHHTCYASLPFYHHHVVASCL